MGVRDRVVTGKSGSDDFQTPPSAVEYLLPFLKPFYFVWEPACGKGNISNVLSSHGKTVLSTDIIYGDNFLDRATPPKMECIVTNPPFSLKDEFLASCYKRGLPFALLLPLAAIGEQARVKMFRDNGLQVLIPNSRINYETPSGKKSSAWFFSAWFTWGLNLPSDLYFAPQAEPVQQKSVQPAMELVY